MCIIFYNEHGATYNERELQNAATANEDGAGIMWVQDGKVQTHHVMIKDGDELVSLMKDFEGIPHMLHLRYATHGDPSTELCHPFRATPDETDQHVWLMHNGVLTQYAKLASKTESDTSVFARHLQRVVTGFESSAILYHERYIDHLESVIDGDRMIFLRDDGHVRVLNPGSWYRDKESGIWYSNLYSIADRPRYKASKSFTWSPSTSRAWFGGHDLDWDDAFGTDDTKPTGSNAASKTEAGFGPSCAPHSAAESAKVFAAAMADASDERQIPLVLQDGDGELLLGDDDDDAEDDDIFYFRWLEAEGQWAFCDEEDADIEVDSDEFFERMGERAQPEDDEETTQAHLTAVLRSIQENDEITENFTESLD